MSDTVKVNVTAEINLNNLKKNFHKPELQDYLVRHLGEYETSLVNFIVDDGILDLFANDPQEIIETKMQYIKDMFIDISFFLML